MNLTTTNTGPIAEEQDLSRGRWHAFTFSGTFAGVSVQPVDDNGVPLTEDPITSASRRAIFVGQAGLSWDVTGGTAPSITTTAELIR